MVRAFDQDTGKVLWMAELPAVSGGIPAMCEVNGRQYLVVTAAASGIPGRPDSGNAADARAYVACALPEEPEQ